MSCHGGYIIILESTRDASSRQNVAPHSTARCTDHAVSLHGDVVCIGHASSTTMSSVYFLWRDGAYLPHFDRREPRCVQPAP